MALNVFSTVCPDDCSDVLTLPAIDVDQDCTGYADFRSQIGDLWIKPATAADTPFTDWADVFSAITANASAIDNTVTDNSKVKWLVGIGGVPAPEKTTQPRPKFRSKVTRRIYTLTFTVPNVSDANRAMGEALQCGDTNFTFWYGNEDHVFGKSAGIEPASVDVDFPLGEGEDDTETMIITITWEATGDPQRRNNPYS